MGLVWAILVGGRVSERQNTPMTWPPQWGMWWQSTGKVKEAQSPIDWGWDPGSAHTSWSVFLLKYPGWTSQWQGLVLLSEWGSTIPSPLWGTGYWDGGQAALKKTYWRKMRKKRGWWWLTLTMAHSLPDFVLNASHALLICSVFTTSLWSKYCYYSPFTDEDMEAH